MHAGLEADRVDDEHVAFPMADRVARVARRDVRRMLGHVHVDHALEAEEAVVDDDAVLLLRDPVDGAVEHPVEDDARGPAAQPRVVLGRPHPERVRLRFAARGEASPAVAPQPDGGMSFIATFPDSTSAIRLFGTSPPPPPAARAITYCSCAQSPEMFGSPDGRRSGAIREVDLRRDFELIVAIHARRIADLDVLEVARASDRRDARSRRPWLVAPTTNISGVQPERRSSVAARISQRIAMVLPSAPIASKRRYECGFTKSMPRITP